MLAGPVCTYRQRYMDVTHTRTHAHTHTHTHAHTHTRTHNARTHTLMHMLLRSVCDRMSDHVSGHGHGRGKKLHLWVGDEVFIVIGHFLKPPKPCRPHTTAKRHTIRLTIISGNFTPIIPWMGGKGNFLY